jgi:hypothetical protein
LGEFRRIEDSGDLPVQEHGIADAPHRLERFLEAQSRGIVPLRQVAVDSQHSHLNFLWKVPDSEMVVGGLSDRGKIPVNCSGTLAGHLSPSEENGETNDASRKDSCHY